MTSHPAGASGLGAAGPVGPGAAGSGAAGLDATGLDTSGLDATMLGETPPGETSHGETSHGETRPGQTRPGETRPGETPLGETPPGQTPPGQTRRGETRAGSGLPGTSAPPVLAGRPGGPVEVPRSVRDLVGDAPDVVWLNELGGLTFRLPGAYLKWAPRGSGLDLAAEAERLAWAGPLTAVPEVLDRGADGDGSWLVTRLVPGRSAVDERWLRDPATAVRAVGAGLRALHDALPVDDCPFDWGVSARLGAARRRVVDQRAAGRLDAAGETEQRRRDAALAVLGDPPAVDRLVVCHGDPCVPNTLLDDAGRWTGHVDLGALGVADRWADLAVATWSTVWNYGPGHEARLLEAYGVEPDPARTAYYRALWDLT